MQLNLTLNSRPSEANGYWGGGEGAGNSRSLGGWSIEILDLECVLCHVTGVQNEIKNALINPPSWIFPRSVVYKISWGEFKLPS